MPDSLVLKIHYLSSTAKAFFFSTIHDLSWLKVFWFLTKIAHCSAILGKHVSLRLSISVFFAFLVIHDDIGQLVFS